MSDSVTKNGTHTEMDAVGDAGWGIGGGLSDE